MAVFSIPYLVLQRSYLGQLVLTAIYNGVNSERTSFIEILDLCGNVLLFWISDLGDHHEFSCFICGISG